MNVAAGLRRLPALILVLILHGCGDDRRSGAIIGSTRPEDSAAHAFVRLVLSRRPSFNPMVGEQWCRVYCVDSSWTITPGPLPGDGEVSLWRWKDGGWQLSDVLYFQREMEPDFEWQPTRCIPPECWGSPRIGIAIVSRVVREDPDLPRLETSPCQGATVTLVAGRFGTPTWDAPTAVSNQRGIVQFGTLAGDMWYADVSAPGYCRLRVPVPAPSDDAEDVPWFPLYPARQIAVEVRVADKPAPAGTELRVAIPDVGGSLDLCYPAVADGVFLVEEPIDAITVYVAKLPDGRTRTLRRFGQDGAIIMSFP